jgi:hypothetical protein
MSNLAPSTDGRSQHLTLSRRELLQKTASVALPLALRLQSEKSSQLQFWIGDRIVSSWLDGDGRNVSQSGEVVGVCLHPQKRQWEYLVNWTCEDSCGRIFEYFDESLTGAEDLELVSHD